MIFNLMHDWCTRSPLYGIMLRKSVRGELRGIHQDSWPPVSRNTRSLSAGLYRSCGVTLTVAELLKNLSEPKMDPQTVSLHTFDFLRDLHALGDNNCRRLARQCISHWIDNNSQWSNKPWRSPSWNLDILGYRICNWLGFYEFFANSADQLFKKKLITSIGQQYRFLKRRQVSLKDPISRFRALKGLICACCAFPREQNELGKLIANLHRSLNEQLDEHYNHKSRHPGTLVLLLRDLIDLRLLLRHFYAGQIDFLNECIIRIAPVVRHLRHGDGGLSSFTGNATQRLEAFCDPVLGDALIDMTLSLADSRAILAQPVAMNYVRCSGKPGFILINAEASANSELYEWYQKSTGILDFEWSELAKRLITRGDVSVYSHDSKNFLRYKLNKSVSVTSKIINEKNHGFFSGSYQITQHPSKSDPFGAVFQAKRDLYISPHGDIRGEESFILSQPGQGSIRFLVPAELEWRITNDTESAFLCKKNSGGKSQKSERLKRFLCQGPVELTTMDSLGQHALCVIFPLETNKQTLIKWALSPIN